MEKLNSQQQTRIENKILRLLNHEIQSFESKNAKKHLFYGLGIRLRMMSKSRRLIHDKIDEHNKNKALEGFILNEMNIHLNSYYLNLKGSLDNVAWAINYFYQLEDEINESDYSSRFYTNLFNKDFLDDLEKHDSSLVAEIKKFEDWSSEVKKFRDPAAHRIPLQFIAGFVDEEQREEIKDLEKEANELFEKAAKLEDSWKIEDIEKVVNYFRKASLNLQSPAKLGTTFRRSYQLTMKNRQLDTYLINLEETTVSSYC